VASRFFRVETETAPVLLDLDPSVVLNGIEENIYGHFLEHIFHSANGGLWGDLVWNRSFEIWPLSGWSINGDELVQSSLDTNIRLLFGDTAWTDYEYTLEALKDGGDEGFLIPFRASGGTFYWLNLGGWNNTRHQLEKGQGNPVGPSYAGSILPGQWYGIRIRCEGSHIQCWLDDGFGEVNIIDWTDPEAPILSGQVGVGTWATQARFRNISVDELGGTNLYNGLPSLEVPDHKWMAFGPCTVSQSVDARNSYWSAQVVKTGSTEGGLRQTPFLLDLQPYTGSLWAKKSGANVSLTVRLKDGDTVLAETNYPGFLGSTWGKYEFQLSPSAAALNGTVEIAFTGTGTAYLDQVSMMGQDSIDTGGYRPDLLNLASNIAPPVIRWPGGCFASAYRWKYGIGPQDDRLVHPVYQWSDRDVNSFGTDEFIQMCHLIGAEPILVLNVGVENPCAASDYINHPAPEAELLQDALDWIEYCNGDTNTTWGAVRAANGHPEPYNVKYWEIDNETWSMGSTWYIGKVNQYAPLMRAADPSIKLIAVGSGWADQSWNQDILNGCATNIDYISVHSYLSPDEYASGPLAYEAYIIQLAGMIAASDNPAVQIYNSEWNAQSIDLRTGLFAGGLLNAFERQGAVFTMGGPALMFRYLGASDWNNAFINFDHTGSFTAPNYVVMKLWRDHYAPYRIEAAGDVGSLNMIATKSEDGQTVHVKVVNPGGVEVRTVFRLPMGSTINTADFSYVTAPSLTTQNSLATPNAVQAVAGTAVIAGETVDVTLPPYSASVITIGL
jgi:alpha-N-arabinofuranosidase